jgi:hypothetical protein
MLFLNDGAAVAAARHEARVARRVGLRHVAASERSASAAVLRVWGFGLGLQGAYVFAVLHGDFSAEAGMKAAEVARQQEHPAQASAAPTLALELRLDVGVRARGANRGVKAEATARGAAIEEAGRPFRICLLPLRGAILVWSVSHASELCTSLRLQMAAFSATTLARWQVRVNVPRDCKLELNCQRLCAAAHVARVYGRHANGPSPLPSPQLAGAGRSLSVCSVCVYRRRRCQPQEEEEAADADADAGREREREVCVTPATSGRGRQQKPGFVVVVKEVGRGVRCLWLVLMMSVMLFTYIRGPRQRRLKSYLPNLCFRINCVARTAFHIISPTVFQFQIPCPPSPPSSSRASADEHRLCRVLLLLLLLLICCCRCYYYYCCRCRCCCRCCWRLRRARV